MGLRGALENLFKGAKAGREWIGKVGDGLDEALAIAVAEETQDECLREQREGKMGRTQDGGREREFTSLVCGSTLCALHTTMPEIKSAGIFFVSKSTTRIRDVINRRPWINVNRHFTNSSWL